MKCLVTGSAGFVGRHMVRALAERGWDVLGIDTVGTSGFRAWHRDLHEYINDLWPQHPDRFDLVVHLAYHVGGRQAIDGKPRLLAKNLKLDAALFDWAVRTEQRRVLYFSSSAAYPIQLQTGEFETRLEEVDIDLDDAAQPDARYGWAKLTGEQLARAASETDLAVHVVRPFSGYAEDQSLDYPFPSIVDRARQGDLTVWGPPGQTRDWIHISDVVAGALAVVDADCREPVNLCTGVGTEMGDLARLAAGQPNGEVGYDLDMPTGVMYRVGDPTRLHEIYTPKITIEEGVRKALG
jgi:nucleoside-diphosphate-sugar epimerase